MRNMYIYEWIVKLNFHKTTIILKMNNFYVPTSLSGFNTAYRIFPFSIHII